MHEKLHWHTVYMYRTSLIEMKTRLLIVEKIGRLSQDNDVVIQKIISSPIITIISRLLLTKSFGMDSMYQHSSCRHKTNMNDVDVWREFPKIAPDLE